MISHVAADSKQEFNELLEEQVTQLAGDAARAFAPCRVPIATAVIRRSAAAGDETVFYVAMTLDGILYFDDVEYGFNFSPLDSSGMILQPGGSQMNLADGVRTWLVPRLLTEEQV